MLSAFERLDHKLPKSAKLLLGGGGAMVLAHGFPLATMDVDALFYKTPFSEADVLSQIHEVAVELNIPHDWLNPYFGTFLYTLPPDYETRLKTIFRGHLLEVNALGLDDLLILKCFAGRDKDIPHARALIKKGANIDFVAQHIHKMMDINIPKADQARDFLDDLIDEVGG
ncbi:MAG: hypothetical protein ACD_62C00330G0002 [uncultured bacterium]|nr:MAG: hypothetical protein ACD_62C00330G0002 [uncultured bacterium]